jgi:hypothetical protein
MSEINRRRAQYVDDISYGIYVWVLPSGAYFSDDEGNVLSIAAKKGDLIRIQKLYDFAKIYGAPDGRAHFLSGHRKITDEEFAEQFRQQFGYALR